MTTSLSGALLIASSGLTANQTQLDVVSRNVANSQVVGYTTKTAPLESIVTGTENSGVRTLAVTREVNQALLRQVQLASSTNSQLTTQNTFLQAFQSNFGSPGNTTNLTAQIGNLQNAFSALTNSPDNPTAQTQAITVAQNLVQQFNSVATNISAVREQADQQIATSVTNVNTALNQIFTLNNQIVQLKAQGLSTADLEDQRDDEINAIAQEMNIQTSANGNGAIYIQTSNGTSLLDATYNPATSGLTFNQTPVILPGSAYYPPPSSSLSSQPLSGIKVNGVDITSQITGGNIAGDLNVRDNLMPATQSQLDELAGQLITKFNNNDLQLFLAGTNVLPSADSVQDVGGVAAAAAGVASTITVPAGGTTGLTVGMTLTFASQPNTPYVITSISGGTNQITFVQANPSNIANATTGLTQAVPQGTNVTFGPAIPQIKVGSSASVGAGTGVPATNVITLSGAVGAQVNMRIKFANDPTTYTITSVATNGSGQQTITVQPDGGSSTTGLLVALTAGEAISIQPPVTGLVGLANNISVNPVVVNNPWRMRDGTRLQQPSTLTGNNTLPTNIVSMFNTQQTFTTNTGLATLATLQNFGTAAIAFQANAAATTQASLDSASTIYTSLNKQFQDQSGVNVDTQLANMIQIQSSYEASARTITAIQQMMQQLLQAVQG
jgi:flagellar hook-associated protein 1 FlgK